MGIAEKSQTHSQAIRLNGNFANHTRIIDRMRRLNNLGASPRLNTPLAEDHKNSGRLRLHF